MDLPALDRPALLALLLLLPLLAAAEGAWRVRRGLGYDWKAWWSSLGDVAGRAVLNRVIGGGLAGLLLVGVSEFRLADIAMDRWWHWVALFLGQELCYYWMHRADHRVRWFWLNHAVHHTPQQFALSSAYRLGWTGRITAASVFFAPLVLLGFPVPAVLGMLAANLLYQYWLHTELVGRLPRWIEWTFNTPAHHRVHHASNPEYLDCNYGGVLVVFDRLFGTLREVRDDVAIRYGLTEPVHGYNPVRIAFHAWPGFLRDLRLARGPREHWLVVFGPPAFRPALAQASTTTTSGAGKVGCSSTRTGCP